MPVKLKMQSGDEFVTPNNMKFGQIGVVVAHERHPNVVGKIIQRVDEDLAVTIGVGSSQFDGGDRGMFHRLSSGGCIVRILPPGTLLEIT